jgi:HAD superfamily hydrolase (TIGR01509 family)
MIQTVIFDVGGVLKAETDAAIQRDIIETLGISSEALKEPWQVLTNQLGRGDITEEEFWEQLHQQTEAPNPLPEESLLIREYRKGYKPNEEVLQIATRLRDAGYVTPILSNTIASHAALNRERGLYDGFDPIILSQEVGLLKPSPEIFTLTLTQLGVNANEVAFIDDAAKNTLAAQSLGINSILFTDALQLEEALHSLGFTF